MNTLAFSHNDQFVAIGGFENLPGDVVIYDCDKFKQVCQFNCQCTTQWAWSSDNKYVFCGHCFPRRHSDNKVVIFGIDGKEIDERDVPIVSFDLIDTPSLNKIEFDYVDYGDQKSQVYVPPSH